MDKLSLKGFNNDNHQQQTAFGMLLRSKIMDDTENEESNKKSIFMAGNLLFLISHAVSFTTQSGTKPRYFYTKLMEDQLSVRFGILTF